MRSLSTRDTLTVRSLRGYFLRRISLYQHDSQVCIVVSLRSSCGPHSYVALASDSLSPPAPLEVHVSQSETFGPTQFCPRSLKSVHEECSIHVLCLPLRVRHSQSLSSKGKTLTKQSGIPKSPLWLRGLLLTELYDHV